MLLLWSLGPGRRRETMSACCTPVGKLRRRRRRRSKLLHSKAKRSHLIKLASIPMIMMKNNSRRYTDSISSMPCGQSRESRLVEKFSLKKMITCGTYAALSKILQISKEPWAPLTLLHSPPDKQPPQSSQCPGMQHSMSPWPTQSLSIPLSLISNPPHSPHQWRGMIYRQCTSHSSTRLIQRPESKYQRNDIRAHEQDGILTYQSVSLRSC